MTNPKLLVLCVMLASFLVTARAEAKTYFLPDYQASFAERAGNATNGGGDVSFKCETYGYYSSVPANMNCSSKTVMGKNCYTACSCKSGYKPNSDPKTGCSVSCAGYALASGLNCALGQTIEYCSGDSNYGKCVGTPCPTGTSDCGSGKYCASYDSNSRPGICPTLCNNCVNCPANQACSGTTCSITETHVGCSNACVKCCPQPLSCKWGCQKYSTEANCGSVCIECKAPVCTPPAGSDWRKIDSSLPTTACGALAGFEISSKDESDKDLCDNTYKRCCLLPIEGKNWSTLPTSGNLTSVAPTTSTGMSSYVEYFTPVTQSFVSCDKSYSRTCKNYLSPRWMISPVASSGSTISSPYYCTMTTSDNPIQKYIKEENQSCDGLKYYSCCAKPNEKMATGYTLVATNDTSAETFGPFKETGGTFTTVSESEIGIKYNTVNEILASCGNRYARPCRTYYFTATNMVLPSNNRGGTSSTTPTTPSTTTPIMPGDGTKYVSETYYDGCSADYYADCRVPKQGYGYAASYCGAITADWSTNFPTSCGPEGSGVIRTTVNCGVLLYKCDRSGVSQSPAKTTVNPCYYSEGNVKVDTFTSCGISYERICQNFLSVLGWYEPNPEGGPVSTVRPGSIYRNDRCGREFTCYPGTGTTTTPSTDTGTSTTPGITTTESTTGKPYT